MMDAIFTTVYEWGGDWQGVTGRHRQGAAVEEGGDDAPHTRVGWYPMSG